MKEKISTLFLTLVASTISASSSAVTYELSEGRFGDAIQGYLHAKWISYYYQLPLLYKPFLHSDEFALHERDMLWTLEKERNFKYVINYPEEEIISDSKENHVLYYIPFFSSLPEDIIYRPDWYVFPVDWEDKGFVEELRSAFRPLKEHSPIIFPKDKGYLTVALHVRQGGDYDIDDAYLLWPLRFPPESYYIESLRKLCSLYPHRPVYAFVFTDDPDPERLITSFKSKLPDLPITFDCRKREDQKQRQPLDDFFAMMTFDCLIRSSSNFSLIPSVISKYQVVMTPKHSRFKVWEDNGRFTVENYIDQTDIKIYRT